MFFYAGIRIVDGQMSDEQEATAIGFSQSKIDIMSASWGPSDDGTRVESPGPITLKTLEEGVTKVSYLYINFLTLYENINS